MAPPAPTAQLPNTTTPAEPAPGCTLLTVEAAAHHLSIGRTTMYALLKNGDITSVQIGRLRRIPAAALTTYTARLTAEQHTA